MDLHRGPNTISSPSKSSEYEMQIDSVSELRSEYKSDPLRHVFYVAKFMDYSDKYGICYLLSNGDIGLLFNDYTTIVTHEMNW